MQSVWDVLKLNKENLEDSAYKNAFIGRSKQEMLVFFDERVTNEQEIEEVFESYDFLKDYNVVVFGEGVPEGEADLNAVLTSASMRIFGMVIRKNMLQYTGCFNEKLSAGTDFEFLCRAAQNSVIYCLPCAGDDMYDLSKSEDTKKAYTLAYVLRKYMVGLKDTGHLEEVFTHMTLAASKMGMLEMFNKTLSLFLEDEKSFEKIVENTAPFFVISGDDTCYGVLRDFSNSLAEELVALGQAVMTTNHRYGSFESFEELCGKTFKGIIGFQAPALEDDFFKRIRGRKLQFWFDNPAFFNVMFRNLDDSYYILCQDDYYAKHIREVYGVKNALQFPPAGKDLGLSENDERIYDIVFIGSYYKTDLSCIQDDISKGFFEYMTLHPKETFEEGLGGFLRTRGIVLDEQKFKEVLWSMVAVCRNVINYYRAKVIEKILGSGLEIHVFGDSWKGYEGACKERLIIHPEVSVEESLKIFSKAKIGLNIMTWHKAGMTERIANVMMSGAVCVSDETVYLRKHFEEDEEIVLFELDKLDELPLKLKKILSDEDYRKEVAKKAYQKAIKEHTWERRARELLSLLDEE